MRKLLLSMLLIPALSSANVIISSTRVIYPSDSKEISVQLLNNGSLPSLVQSWIDDGDPKSTPETANVPFLVMPPVVKVGANSGQQLKVRYIGGNQPSDRESVFFLNVLDIPPVPDNLQGKNVMQLAIKSRIKFFFRPAGITLPIKKMIDKVNFLKKNNHLIIDNPTPYYVTFSALNLVKSGTSLIKEGIMVSPLSQLSLSVKPLPPAGEKIEATYINDYGANIKTKKEIR